MAHLWRETLDRSWEAVPLTDGVAMLAPSSESHHLRNVAVSEEVTNLPTPARLISCDTSTRRCVLIAAPSDSMRVNGESIGLGIRVLNDKDEIVSWDERGEIERSFLSTEEAVAVVPFPGGDHATRCARCKTVIEPGAPAVKCPNCQTWHHQVAEGDPDHEHRECWTYSAVCAHCPHETALDSGFRWTPDGL